jgi:hypothetical protein
MACGAGFIQNSQGFSLVAKMLKAYRKFYPRDNVVSIS